MQIRVSPGIAGPVLRGVVVVLIGGPMKRSVGAMGLKSSVPRASESFVCHHGSFQPLWPEPQQYATSIAPQRPAYSRTNSASCHPSGVENVAAPDFDSFSIGFCLPSRGSIQKLVE